jgi:hypothetical protein
VLGQQLAPDLGGDEGEVELLLVDDDGAVQPQEFGLVGGDIGDVVQELV